MLHIYIFKKHPSQSKKSLQEYFTSPFICTHIYIHSSARIYDTRSEKPLTHRMEGMPDTHITHTSSIHSASRSGDLNTFSKSNISSSNIPFSEPSDRWTSSAEPWLFGIRNHLSTLRGLAFVTFLAYWTKIQNYAHERNYIDMFHMTIKLHCSLTVQHKGISLYGKRSDMFKTFKCSLNYRFTLRAFQTIPVDFDALWVKSLKMGFKLRNSS